MYFKLKLKILERFGSQCNFARAVGVGESVISRTIRGRRPLSDTERKLWAKKLGCRPQEIFEK